MIGDTENCPYCQADCHADWCDVGVGYVQCGPFHCEVCGASEIGPNDRERVLTEDEKTFGWYGPNTPPGSSANMIGGKIVSHSTMKDRYRQSFYLNPLWHDKKYVDDWWEEIKGMKE